MTQSCFGAKIRCILGESTTWTRPDRQPTVYSANFVYSSTNNNYYETLFLLHWHSMWSAWYITISDIISLYQ